jgi:hypothetical protein
MAETEVHLMRWIWPHMSAQLKHTNILQMKQQLEMRWHMVPHVSPLKNPKISVIKILL